MFLYILSYFLSNIISFIIYLYFIFDFFFFSSRRRHTRCLSDWSSDVCSSDLTGMHRVEPRGGPIACRTRTRLALDHFGISIWIFGLAFLSAATADSGVPLGTRSEERRVGKECRSR